jgi:hypothetical protein
MTLTKNLHPWANDGTQESDTTLTDTKRDTGWVGGDRPSKERFNRIQYDIDNDLNKIKAELPIPYSIDFPGLMEQILATGKWPSINFGFPHSGLNEFNYNYPTSTEALRALCVCFDPDTNYPRILALDETACRIDVHNPRSLNPSLEPSSNSGDLSVDLPSGSGQTWMANGMACDNDSVYVVFTDTNASPDTHQIQAWDISTWDVKTGWPATGTALPLTGGGTASDTRACNVIVSSSAATLAVIQTALAVSSSSTAILSIIDIDDGTINASGAGDAPTGGTYSASDSLASDGSYVYFTVRDLGTPDVYICSAAISDPTTGCGGTGYPLQVSGATRAHLCNIGSAIASCYGYSTDAEDDEVLRVHTSTDADMDVIYRGQSSYSTPVTNEKWLYSYPRAMCFDGINLWIYATSDIYGTGASDPVAGLIKFDVSKFLLNSPDTGLIRQLNDLAHGPFLINSRAVNIPSLGQSIVFDGRDVFCTWETTAGNLYSGRLYRLAKAILRS